MLSEYEAAREYVDRGWSILPMAMADKKPARRWKRYQRHPASDGTIRNWFRNTDHGVGVIFGAVSGCLASRDFDDRKSYRDWSDSQPSLAAELPTVETRRGFHVYCNAWPESVSEARSRLGRDEDGVGAIAVNSGELRAGVGCYSVLPPSVHETGHIYRWMVPLPDGELPFVDVCDVDFVDFEFRKACYREHREYREHRANGSEDGCVCDESDDAKVAATNLTIEDAIITTLPTAPGQRRRQVFDLCRSLKAVPDLHDADPRDLRGLVEHWHGRALPHISTKPFEETWIDFLQAWPNVRFPKGAEPMAVIFERACSAGLSDVAERYEQSELQLLVAVCRELQRAAGEGPFYLSCRTAGRLVEVDHMTANRWLFLLTAEGVLELVNRGDRKSRRASRFRYRGDL